LPKPSLINAPLRRVNTNERSLRPHLTVKIDGDAV
jgi:hypothetical protein